MSRIEAAGAWPARVLWVALALVASGPLGDALHHRSTPVVAVAAVVLWSAWGVGLAALLVPRTTSLTVVRAVVPGGLAATAWAATRHGAPTGLAIASVTVAALAVVAALSPWVAESFVDGSAYGRERRTPLRTPPLLAGLLAPLTWAVISAGAVAGPLLLAAHRWAVGGVLLVAGWPLAYAGARSLHQLARRWIVIVPAGLVLHDPLTMPEPQLFLRAGIRRVGPAEDPATVGAEALTAEGLPAGRAIVTEDLTAGASGLALELVLDEPVELLLRAKGRKATETRAVDRVLFTPSRPLVVLEAARGRKIPVG